MKRNLLHRIPTGEKFLFHLILMLSLVILMVLHGFLLLAGTPEAKSFPANPYFQQGKDLAKARDYHKAIQLFTIAIREDGRQAAYYYARGLARSYADQLEGSILDCDSAIILDPCYAEAYLVRGISKAVLGDLEGSMADLEEAAALKSNDGEVFYNIGLNYFELKDKANAGKNFKLARQLGFEVKNLESYLRK